MRLLIASGITSRELTQLEALYALEGFGEKRADRRQALDTAWIVNQIRGALGSKSKPIELDDVDLSAVIEKAIDTAQHPEGEPVDLAWMLAWADSVNASVKKRE